MHRAALCAFNIFKQFYDFFKIIILHIYNLKRGGGFIKAAPSSLLCFFNASCDCFLLRAFYDVARFCLAETVY
jgi:hypothetical protein